jgi:Ca-activated chloride channel family protein
MGLLLFGTGCPPEVPKEDPGLVKVETSVDKPVIPAGRTGEVTLQVTVRAEQPPRAVRPPLNLAVVIDTSGSMEGQPIEDARTAVGDLLGRLRAGDRAVLVGFGSVATVLGKGVWTSDVPPRELDEAIGKIEAAGTTDMRAGITAALTETAEWRDATHLSRMILLSDGRPNDPSGLVDMARSAGNQMMPIVAFGLGIEYDEVLLADMARASGGSYAFLAGSDQIAERFAAEVLKLETLVARGVSLEIVPGPGIEILEVLGWDDLSPGREAVVALGDLVGGKEREVLLRLSHGEHSHEARVELADVKIRYLDSYGESGYQERTYYVGLRASEDVHEVEAAEVASVRERHATVLAHVIAFRAAEVMRRGRIEEAAGELDDGIARYRETLGYDFEDEAVEGELLGREEYTRLVRLRQAVERADEDIAARARDEAREALDAAGVGAVTVAGQEATGIASGTGSAGGGGGYATSDSAGPMPAAMPAPAEPYEWGDVESEEILESHSRAFEGIFGD